MSQILKGINRASSIQNLDAITPGIIDKWDSLFKCAGGSLSSIHTVNVAGGGRR